MSKYLVYAPVDYVVGHLRYGHFEGEIEIPDDKLTDKDWIRQAIREDCELLVDDWEIDDYGSIEMECLEMTKLKEEPDNEETTI